MVLHIASPWNWDTSLCWHSHMLINQETQLGFISQSFYKGLMPNAQLIKLLVILSNLTLVLTHSLDPELTDIWSA